MKLGTDSKIKFLDLKRRLGLRLWQTTGLLETLWQVTYRNAPAGDIGRISDDSIAAALEWEGPADELINALVEFGWLDRDDEFRLVVHDWSEHVAQHLKGGFAKHGKKFADQVVKSRGEVPAKQGALGTLPSSGAKQGAKQDANSTLPPSQAKPSQANTKGEVPAKQGAKQKRANGRPKPAPVPEPFPAELDRPEFHETWAKFKRHRREIKKPLGETAAAEQLLQLAKLGFEKATNLVQTTITSGWQGLRDSEGRPLSQLAKELDRNPEDRCPTDEDLANWNPVDGGLGRNGSPHR